MYCLDEQIAQWRKHVVPADGLSQSDLTELEQHLRDSIADFQQRGLAPEEAFLIASRRLGAGDALATEFGKVSGSYVWRRRVFWMLAGYLIVRIAGAWIGTLSSGATAVAAYVGLNGAAMGTIAIVVTCAGWLFLFLALYALAFFGGTNISRWRSSTAVIATFVISASVLGALLAAGGRIMTARLVSAEVFGQSILLTSAANFALQLLIPVICLIMIGSLQRDDSVMSPQG